MRIIKFLFYTAIFGFMAGAVVLYFMDIMPTSIGIHPKIYEVSSVALNKYDIVGYHTQKKANMGDITFNYKYKDLNWFFTSAANLKMFQRKPQKYIPQFGGYCAYTMSKGFTYPPDPNAWHFDKGKLYFFKDKETKQLALADWEKVKENARLHWN